VEKQNVAVRVKEIAEDRDAVGERMIGPGRIGWSYGMLVGAILHGDGAA